MLRMAQALGPAPPPPATPNFARRCVQIERLAVVPLSAATVTDVRALTYVEGPWAYPGGASEPAGVAWYPQSDRDKSAPSPRDAASGVRGTQETP